MGLGDCPPRSLRTDVLLRIVEWRGRHDCVSRRAGIEPASPKLLGQGVIRWLSRRDPQRISRTNSFLNPKREERAVSDGTKFASQTASISADLTFAAFVGLGAAIIVAILPLNWIPLVGPHLPGVAGGLLGALAYVRARSNNPINLA